MTGGYTEIGDQNRLYNTKWTLRYDLMQSRWFTECRMISARRQHTSCVLGSNLYVAAGYDSSWLDTIEMLDISSVSEDKHWVSVKNPRIASMFSPWICPLNENELLVING